MRGSGRKAGIAAALVALAAVAGGVILSSDPGTAEAAEKRFLIGRSVEGRAILAYRLGDPSARRRALVVGVIHGDERAGLRVIRRLRNRWKGIKGVDLWVVPSVNPDGEARRTRRNARGVDLNRNFPHRWRGGVPRSSGYYPGPRPRSEPETRAVMRFVRRIRPVVSIWYHQPWGAVLACRGRPRIAQRYSRLSKLRTSCRGRGLSGTAIGWQNASLRRTRAFVVEFGSGALAAPAARRHARAAAIVARDGAGRRHATAPAAARRAATSAAIRRIVPRPRIRRWRIPYPKRRKGQMAAYSRRHYGRRDWRLRDPKLIVQHVAVAGSVRSVRNTFAANRRDPELGELPGVCAHYVISPRGRIYELVRPGIRCRHVIGLNHVSIGIEHVGFRDADVLGRKRQLRASLRLSRWLRCRFGIPVRGVIGHAESLSSPHYRELVPSARGRTHSDFRRRSMRTYRRKLRRLGRC